MYNHGISRWRGDCRLSRPNLAASIARRLVARRATRNRAVQQEKLGAEAVARMRTAAKPQIKAGNKKTRQNSLGKVGGFWDKRSRNWEKSGQKREIMGKAGTNWDRNLAKPLHIRRIVHRSRPDDLVHGAGEVGVMGTVFGIDAKDAEAHAIRRNNSRSLRR